MKYRFALFLWICVFCMQSQQNPVDSMLAIVAKSKQDTAKIRLYAQITEVCDLPDVAKYAEPAMKLLEKVELNSTKTNLLTFKCMLLVNLSAYYQSQGDFSAADSYLQKALDVQKGINDSLALGSIYHNLGVNNEYQGHMPEAIAAYEKSLAYKKSLKDKESLTMTLNSIGVAYSKTGQIEKGLEYLHKSLKIREEIKDDYGVGNSLLNIGYLLEDQGQVNEAITYYERALVLMKKVNDKEGISYAYNNIGYTYQHKKNYAKSLDYFFLSLEAAKEIGNKRAIANLYNNISTNYVFLGQTEKAIEYTKQAIKLQEEANMRDELAFSLMNMGDIYARKKETKQALEYTLKAYALSNEVNLPNIISQTSFQLFDIYKKKGDFGNALKYYEVHIKMRDSMANESTRKASLKKQLQYEYGKKAAADSVKNAEEQKVKDAEILAKESKLEQEKVMRYALFGGIFLIAGFLVFVFNRFRITQRQKKIIELQKKQVDTAYETLHEKNKEIMDSIHYAQRIQRALI